MFTPTSTSIPRRARSVIGVLAAALAVPHADLAAQRVLTVFASDTGLEVSPSVAAGLTTVSLTLTGKTRRELVVHRVPAGTTPEDVARGAAGRPGKWFERWSFGGPAVPRDSANEARATFELRPGRYVLVAYEVDAARRPRGDRYLWRPLTAVATSVLIPARFDDADLRIKVKDASVEVLGGLRRGQRTIRVENVGGRPHEVIIARLKPGKTVDDVQKWSRDRGGPEPFIYVGGLTPMSPGMTAQSRLVFQAGTHVILCPMRDDARKVHDNARGVVATFDVT